MISTALVIIGAGGFGREVLDVVEAVNMAAGSATTWRFLGFLDDGQPDLVLLGRRQAAHLGPTERLRCIDAAYVIAIADPPARRRVDELCQGMGKAAAILVHPTATIGSDTELGHGTIVTAGVRVTTHIALGRHVHLHVNSCVGHDSVLGDYVTALPAATISGNVILEDEVTLGANSVVTQGLRVGQRTTVGAGAVVVRDLPPGVTAVGVPARPRVP